MKLSPVVYIVHFPRPKVAVFKLRIFFADFFGGGLEAVGEASQTSIEGMGRIKGGGGALQTL